MQKTSRLHKYMSAGMLIMMLLSYAIQPVAAEQRIFEQPEKPVAEQSVTVEPVQPAAAGIITPVECQVIDTYAVYLPRVLRPIGNGTATNAAPRAYSCRAYVQTGNTAAINLVSLANDPEGEPLSFRLESEPAHGNAALLDTLLMYTPTATLNITDVLHYAATDPQAASGRGRIELVISDTAPNHAPTAADSVVSVMLTETVSLDLSSVTFDPDNDPLTYTLTSLPTTGTVSLDQTTLWYTPTTPLTTNQVLEYAVEDGRGSSDTGTITFSPQPTRLHFTPGSALLAGPGESRAITVTAYDPLGKLVDATELDLEWVTTKPLSVSLTPGADGTTARITSTTSLGSIPIVVRSRSHAEVEPGLFMLTVAEIKPDVRVVSDAELIFPQANPLPNRDNAFPTDGQGNTIIGPFTAEEVFDVFRVQEMPPVNGNEALPVFSYPVMLQGAAPAVGQLLVAGESAPVMGKVVAVIEERQGAALVQVTTQSFNNLFDQLAVDFDSVALIESGLLRPEQFIFQAPKGLEDKLNRQRRPTALSGILENCEVAAGVSAFEVKALSPAINLRPGVSGNLLVRERADGVSYTSHFLIQFGMMFSVEAGIGIRILPTAALEVSCGLAPEFRAFLPDIGVLALVNLLLGPNVHVEPKAEFGIKGQGAFTIEYGVAAKLGFDFALGYEYKDPDGFNGNGEWIKRFDPIHSFDTTTNHFDPAEFLEQLKVEFSVQVVAAANAGFLFGGRLLDWAARIPGLSTRAEELKKKLSADLFGFKVGPQLKIEWGSSGLVRHEKGNFKSSMPLALVASAELNLASMFKVGEQLQLGFKWVDLKLFEAVVPLAAYYAPLSPGTAVASSTGKLKVDTPVEFIVKPQTGLPGDPILRGEVYYGNRKLTDLQVDTSGTLKGTFVLDQEFCTAVEATSTGKGKLDVLAYNRLPNNISGWPAGLTKETANYVGEIELGCRDFSLTINTNPGLETLKAEVLTPCRDDVRLDPQPFKVPYTIVANDDWKLLTRLSLDVKQSGSGLFTLWREAGDGSTRQQELKLEGELLFPQAKDDTEQVYTMVVIASAPDGTTTPRERKQTIPIRIKWQDCSETQITLGATTSVKNTEDGYAIACLNKQQDQVQISVDAQAINSDGVKAIHLQAEYRGQTKTHVYEATDPQATSLATTFNFAVSSWDNPQLNQPMEIKITALVRHLNAAGQEQVAKKERTVKVWWLICEEVKEYDSRTTIGSCWINREERIKTDQVYKNLALEEVRREKGKWGSWYITAKTSTGSCGRPIRRGGGDPHLHTPDGFQYDSFALGEFVYLQPRTIDGGFTIQARQERVATVGNFALFPWTSWITALAVEADGTVFEFRPLRAADQQYPIRINGVEQLLDPGLYTFGAVDLKLMPDRVELVYGEYSLTVQSVLGAFMDFMLEVPRDATHEGMLGTPDGDIDNDFVYPDGSPATDEFAMADAWRIHSAADSLFTYAEGQGPQTYNRPQIGAGPSLQELAPYLTDAEILLELVCNTDQLDPIAVRNTAVELLTGRDPAELLATGLCWYVVAGQVTNSLVAGLPVPGAKVTVTTADTPPCVTFTDRRGLYQCALPSMGQAATVTVAVSERGSASTQVQFDALPEMGGTLKQDGVDLQVAPTTVQIDGQVEDAGQQPLVNAEVRITGSEDTSSTFARAAGDGRFTAYLMVADGITQGDVRYDLRYSPSWTNDPRALGYVQSIEQSLPVLVANELTPVSPMLEMAGGVVRFRGRVAYADQPDQGVLGAPVSIVPTTTVAGWSGCDVLTDAQGFYICELFVPENKAFEVQIQVGSFFTSAPRTVDLTQSGVSSVVDVVQNASVDMGVLQISGSVEDSLGNRLPGAEITLMSNALLPGQQSVRADGAGIYTATMGFASSQQQVDLQIQTRSGVAQGMTTLVIADLQANGVNTRTVDVRADGVELAFAGTLVNTFAPEVPLEGTVAVSRGNQLLCEAPLDKGSYECSAALAQASNGESELEYMVSGPWGVLQARTIMVGTPPTGMSRLLSRSFVAEPTTLKLAGRVQTGAAQPLAGATVRVEAAQLFAETKTNAAGEYNLTMVVPVTLTQTTLQYRVQYRQSVLNSVAPVALVPQQLNTHTENLSYDITQATFKGQVETIYGSPLAGTRLEINAAQWAAPCVSMSSSDGAFQCVALLNSTAPVSVTWTASGFWGSQVVTTTLNPASGNLEQTRVFRVAPTSLRLTGRVVSPAGSPVSGASVTVRGAVVQQHGVTRTQADGSYEVFALIDAGTSPLTASLFLQAGFGQATVDTPLQVHFRPGQLSDVQRDVTLNGAVLRFAGSLRNQFTNQALSDSRVFIDAVGRGRLCSIETLNMLRSGSYSCDVLLFDPQPLELIYTVRGPWGTEVLTDQLQVAPALGQVKDIHKVLYVRPTTVEMRGKVATVDGKALRGVSVAVTAPSLTQAVRTTTDALGNYQAFGVLRHGTISETAQYQVALADQRIEREVVLAPAPGQLSTLEHNFTLNGVQQLLLQGQVHNATYPAAHLDGSLTIFDANINQEVCRTRLANGAYSCTTTNTVPGSRLLSYRVVAPWGTLVAPAEVVQAGTLTHTRDLTATPGLLVVQGVVKTADGAPVGQAQVGIRSYDTLPGQLSSTQITAAQGVFSTTMFLAPGVSSGQLVYEATMNGNVARAVGTFSLPAHQKLITVEQELIVEQGTLELAGTIINTHGVAVVPESTLLITSAELGPVCVVKVYQAYSCSIQTSHAGPLSLTYRLTGAWGAMTVERSVETLPAPGERSRMSVNLPITPTMLQISGDVYDSNGNALRANIATNTPFVVAQRLETGAGAYTLTLVLDQHVATSNQQLMLEARWASQSQVRPVTLDLVAGQLNRMRLAPWVFDVTQERTINVRAALRNQLVPNEAAAQPTGEIIIRDVNGTPWCRSQGSETVCAIRVYDSQPLEIIVEGTGDWGSVQRHMTISELPAAGETSEVEVVLPVKATTLLVTGIVQRPDASPVAGASIGLTFGNGSKFTSVQTRTAANGGYQAYLLVPAALPVGELHVVIASDGIAQQYGVDGIQITANQLNQRHDTWLFERRRIRFRGTLTNEFVPGMAVPGRVSITAPDFNSAWYCEALIQGQNGAYECDAVVATDQPFEVNYRFSGDWGTLDVGATISDIPAIGGSTIVERNVLARPTTLRFSGQVTDSAGKPLAGTRVLIDAAATEGNNALSQRITTQTDQQGVYTATALLDRNLNQIRLRYDVTYAGVNQQLTHLFSGINQQELNTLNQNIELDARSLTLKGHVLHRDLPELPVGARLLITGPNELPLCETTTSAGGAYQCAIAGVPTEPFSVTYTVRGDWGSNVLTTSVPFGSVGSSTIVTFNPLVTPLALRLHGAVRDGTTAVAGVELSLVGGFVSASSPPVRTTTDAQGRYELHVVLQDGLTTGVLNYRLKSGNTFGVVPVPYAITQGVVLDLPHDIQFTARELLFQGRVQAAQTLNLGLNAQVRISSPLLGDLCHVSTTGDHTYTCRVQVLNQEALLLHYTVFGDWGRTEFDLRVPSGTSGATTSVVHDVAAPATVLHVSGRVSDEQEQPLSGAQVRVLGDSVAAAGIATTAANGTYSLDIAVQAGRELPAITFEVAYNNRTIRSERVYEVVAGTRTDVTADLSFAVRDFLFTGSIHNALYPAMTILPQEVLIESPQLGRLCRAITTMQGTYNCLAQLNVSTPFSTVHTLSGDWGSQAVVGSVTTLPALGGQQMITQTLDYTPTMLLATGSVQDPNGNALSGVTVALSSTQLSTINGVRATTSVSGSYTLPLILKTDQAAEGTLQYSISTDGLTTKENVTFHATAGQLTVVDHPITVTQRTLFFRGFVRNELVPDMDIAADTVTVRLPSTDQTCIWNLQPHNKTSFYTCSIVVTSTEQLEVEYLLDADWGTATFTGTVAAGEYGSLGFVDRTMYVTPTTLLLTGIVGSAGGGMLGSAEVEVRSASFSRGNLNYKDTTDNDGVYNIFVVLQAGASADSVTYMVKRNTLSATFDGTFTAQPAQVTTVEKRLELAERVVSFNGQIQNTLADNRPVGAYNVSIDSPQLGPVCHWQPDRALFGSAYSCFATVAELNSFPITYTVSSDWGTAVITGTVAGGAAGQSTFTTLNLPVAPTTIRVSGFVADPDNIRLPSTRVEFHGGVVALSNVISATNTNTEGAFALDLVLRDTGNPATVSGPVSYTLRRNQAVVQGAHPVHVPLAQRTAVNLPLTFTKRAVSFNGKVLHADLPWMNVPAQKVRVLVGSTELCQWNRVQSTDLFYACSGQLTTTQALSATYHIQGDWGTQVLTTTIPAGLYGSNTSLPNDLLVHPTTVRIYGNVATTAGTALNGATVLAQGPGLVAPASKPTQSGSYELFVLLRQGVTSTPITLTATYQAATMQQVRSVTAQPQQITALNLNWAFVARRVTFNTTTVSAFEPTVALRMRSMKVKDTAGTVLCESTVQAWYSPRSGHSCSANVFTTDAFSVTYTIQTNDLLPQVITDTVPPAAAGSTTTLNPVLPSTATLVRFTGVVSDTETGQPLQHAAVYVDSSRFSEASAVFNATTDAQGRYTFHVALQENVRRVSIEHQMFYGEVREFVESSFEIEPTALNTITRDFGVAEREWYFSGSIYHAGLGNTRLEATAVEVRDAQRGTLCTSGSSSGSDYYSCAVQLTGTAPLSITYVITGLWGTQTFAGSVLTPSVAIGQRQEVTFDPAVAPTTLRLTGVVRYPDNTPVANAVVRARSSALMYADSWDLPYAVTNSTGAYTLYVVLKPEVLSGTLDYEANLSSTVLKESRPFTATARTINPYMENWTFDVRRVRFYGSIRSGWTENTSVYATNVVVSDPVYGELCRWNSLMSSWYDCSAQVRTAEPLTPVFTVSGPWGSDVFTATTPITPPAIGLSSELNTNPVVRPTMLRVVGTVADPQGTPISTAKVVVAVPGSTGYNQSIVQTFSSPTGAYTLDLALKPDNLSGTLGMSINYGEAYRHLTQPYTVSQTSFTTMTLPITLDQRRVGINAAVVHAAFPELDVPVNDVRGTTSDGQTCSSSQYYGSSEFWCSFVVTDTTPLSVSLVITGTWGSATLPPITLDDIPAVGESVHFPRSFVVAPTTLLLAGKVRLPVATGADNARVAVRSPAFARAQVGYGGEEESSDNGLEVDTYTDVTGRYTMPVILRSQVTSGSLSYRTHLNDAYTPRESVLFTGAQLGTTTVFTHDITFNSRQVYLHGDLINTVAPATEYLYAEAFTVTDQLNTVLCSDSGNSYWCSLSLPPTATQLTVTTQGLWGLTTSTVDIPAADVATATQIEHHLPVTVTTLLVRATLVDHTNQPLSWADVSIAAEFADYRINGTSDDQGELELYVVVPDAALTGTLLVDFANDHYVWKTQPLSYSALAGALTTLEVTLTHDIRQVTLNGSLINSHTQDQLSSQRVLVEVPGTDQQCERQVDSHNTISSYYCTLALTQTTALPLRLTVSGDWGSEVHTYTLQAGDTGTWTQQTQHVALTPHVLQINGVLRDSDGTPLGGQYLSLDSSTLSKASNRSVEVADDGSFDLIVTLRAGVQAGELAYSFYHNDALHTLTRSFTAATPPLSTVTHDLQLP